MNAELTQTQVSNASRGWVLYDAECSLCLGLATRYEGFLHRHGFHLAPLQARWVQERLGLTAGAPLSQMGLLTTSGDCFRGADALLEIVRTLPCGRSLYALAHLPGMLRLLRLLYNGIAARRHCLGRGGCSLPKRDRRRRKRVFFELP